MPDKRIFTCCSMNDIRRTNFKSEGYGSWLRTQLLHFRLPSSIVGSFGRFGEIDHHISHVYLYEDDGAPLDDIVLEELHRSTFMVVVCSILSAQSSNINHLIEVFKSKYAGDRILALIIDGDPRSHDSGSACFPSSLLFVVNEDGSWKQVEPIAADIRPGQDNARIAIKRIISGINGIDYYELRNRYLLDRVQVFLAVSFVAVITMLPKIVREVTHIQSAMPISMVIVFCYLLLMFTLSKRTNKYLRTQELKYWAFISYSHSDHVMVHDIWTRLERLLIPWKLVGTGRDAPPSVPRRLRRVFLDKGELPTSTNLVAEIEDALHHSLYLIVMLSKRSVESPWVQREIDLFVNCGKADRIIYVDLDHTHSRVPGAIDQIPIDHQSASATVRSIISRIIGATLGGMRWKRTLAYLGKYVVVGALMSLLIVTTNGTVSTLTIPFFTYYTFEYLFDINKKLDSSSGDDAVETRPLIVIKACLLLVFMSTVASLWQELIPFLINMILEPVFLVLWCVDAISAGVHLDVHSLTWVLGLGESMRLYSYDSFIDYGNELYITTLGLHYSQINYVLLTTVAGGYVVWHYRTRTKTDFPDIQRPATSVNDIVLYVVMVITIVITFDPSLFVLPPFFRGDYFSPGENVSFLRDRLQIGAFLALAALSNRCQINCVLLDTYHHKKKVLALIAVLVAWHYPLSVFMDARTVTYVLLVSALFNSNRNRQWPYVVMFVFVSCYVELWLTHYSNVEVIGQEYVSWGIDRLLAITSLYFIALCYVLVYLSSRIVGMGMWGSAVGLRQKKIATH